MSNQNSKSAKFTVSDVMATTEGEGFNILNERRHPLVTFTYQTRQHATEAQTMIKAALMKVVSVKPATVRA